MASSKLLAQRHLSWPGQRCSYWPAQRCSWPAQRCSYWPAQCCSYWSAQHCLYWPLSSTLFILASSTLFMLASSTLFILASSTLFMTSSTLFTYTDQLTMHAVRFYVCNLYFFRMNFSFPYSHPLDNNKWHVVNVVFTNGFVEVYLDGGVRETRKEFPHQRYNLPHGHIYLGVHKINSKTSANFFNGSIYAFDFHSSFSDYSARILKYYFFKCSALSRSSFGASTWHGFRYAVPQEYCNTRCELFFFFFL